MADPVRGEGPTAQPDLLRAALAGAGTCVWEWNLDTDWLSDVDEGLAPLGYAAGAIGHTQADWDRLIHPGDRAANHAAYLRHARGETELYEHAYRLLTAGGQWRWMLERGRIVERHADGRPLRVVGTQTDITDRLAIERTATQATARLERIAQQVPGMLFQWELAPGQPGRFRYLSERGPDLFGLSVEAALADANVVWSAVEPEDRMRMAEALRDSARTLAEWRCEFRLCRAGSAVRWMLGTAMPERLAERHTVWHGYVEDITARRELEQARHERAIADAANRAKTEFLSRLSHELRTPLNTVLGFAQLMEIDRVERPTPGQLRRLKLIREAGEHLLHMIGDMLDLTRIESGGMSLQREPVGLRALAAQALDMMRSIAERAQVSLLLSDGEETVLAGDRTRLLQVLLNLLSNAIKYSRPGGRVSLRVQCSGADQVQLDVSDTGVGIAAADLPHIFEPFQRGGQARGSVEGAGIGLAVTRALVTLMGGDIGAISTSGAGSVFSVRLPLGH